MIMTIIIMLRSRLSHYQTIYTLVLRYLCLNPSVIDLPARARLAARAVDVQRHHDVAKQVQSRQLQNTRTNTACAANCNLKLNLQYNYNLGKYRNYTADTRATSQAYICGNMWEPLADIITHIASGDL